MSEILVVAFGHKARQGKDFATKAIVEAYKGKYDIRRYAFGDQLKTELYDRLQSPLDPIWGIAPVNYLKLPHPSAGEAVKEEKLRWIEEYRAELVRLMQWYGTEYVRVRDPFYWVKALRKQILSDKPQIAVISDLRFMNEFLWIKSVKGYTVKVTRHGYIDPIRDPNHISETQLDGVLFDFEINCLDGEVEQLRKDAITVMEMILQHYQPAPPDLSDLALEVR